MFEASIAAVCAMNAAVEIAASRLQPEQGSGSLQVGFTDAMYHLCGEGLERLGRYEIL